MARKGSLTVYARQPLHAIATPLPSGSTTILRQASIRRLSYPTDHATALCTYAIVFYNNNNNTQQRPRRGRYESYFRMYGELLESSIKSRIAMLHRGTAPISMSKHYSHAQRSDIIPNEWA
jgi:hypothetical protein